MSIVGAVMLLGKVSSRTEGKVQFIRANLANVEMWIISFC